VCGCKSANPRCAALNAALCFRRRLGVFATQPGYHPPSEVDLLRRQLRWRLLCLLIPADVSALAPLPLFGLARLFWKTMDATRAAARCAIWQPHCPTHSGHRSRTAEIGRVPLHLPATTGRSKGAIAEPAKTCSATPETLVECLAHLHRLMLLLHALPIFHTHGLLWWRTNIMLLSAARWCSYPNSISTSLSAYAAGHRADGRAAFLHPRFTLL